MIIIVFWVILLVVHDLHKEFELEISKISHNVFILYT